MTEDYNEKENTNIPEWELQADIEDRNVRLDKFLSSRLEDEGISREKVKEWIKKGNAQINGAPCKKPNTKLDGDETVTFKGEIINAELIPEKGPLEIVYKDDDLVVINKEAGLTTHPAPSCMTGTLVHRMISYFPEIKKMHEWRPGIVHRLDKDTSGLIVVARHEHSRIRLAEDFASREVSKTYLAIIHGKPDRPFGEIEDPIGRHPSIKTRMAVTAKGGREARSKYEVLWTSSDNSASLVKVRIYTGRTHQIRVHMAHIGHPLVGDLVYGAQQHSVMMENLPEIGKLATSQMLHAFDISFTHPETEEPMHFTSAPPEDFIKVLEALNTRTLRIGLIGMPGSGKSTVLGIFKNMGVPVFSADESVAKSYQEDGDGTELIKQRFGSTYINPETGAVDKKVLFEAMCGEDLLRKEIMDIVHPIVLHEMNEFFKSNSTSDFAVAEIPLLLEGGWHKKGYVDLIVGVNCPEEKRTGELRKKRKISPQMLATLDSWQWDQNSKLQSSDVIINNYSGIDELSEETRKAVNEINKIILEKRTNFKEQIKLFFAPQQYD
ncbi:dephospho-CoA kinase [Maridesulfovibrio bastinii]|uniref:dephospho-CoA kinase n=1 Tax=Maridesulfovibrio bastinii TaxID=47157 RepID=UPI00041ED95B|nr:dephospho-CoA kinase [Maridesulfovibrio bastinii]